MTPPSVVRCERVISAPGVAAEGMWLGGAFFGQNNVGHRPTEHNRNHNEPLPGTMMMAGAEGSDSSTEPELPEAQIQAGRPLLNCVVAGTKVLAFLDSGSEATVVKESCFRRISNTPLSPHPRGLRGASGAALDIKGRATLEFKFSRACKCRHSVFVVDDDTRFPAEVLIGVDLLRRFNFKLNLSPVSGASSASFNGVRLGVSFSGAGSLGILTYHEPEAVLRCCSASGGDREGAMRCARRVTCPPRAGRFVRCLVNGLKGGLACVESDTAKVLVPRSLVDLSQPEVDVWVVNDQTVPVEIEQGFVLCYAAIVEVSLNRLEYDAESMDKDSGVNPEDVGSSSGDSRGALDMASSTPIDDGSEPDSLMADFEDRFDFAHGLNDFGYNMDEFEVFLVCSFENEELPSSAGAVGVPRVDLAHLSSVQREQLVQVLDRYPDLFNEGLPPGVVPHMKHKIKTTDDQPVRVKQWRLPESTRQYIRAECDKMLADGVIELSCSPWLSPVVLVKKKDGSTRFCVDYRALNAKTVSDAYPIPRMDAAIDQLAGKSWFSVLDAKSAYWTVEVDERDREKTAFSDGARLFQFSRMPFGLTTAPSTFQRAIAAVLNPVLGHHALAYLDDVVIYSAGFEQHLSHLDAVLQLLAGAGFRLNLSKCRFATDTFRFLGHLITPDGVLPAPDKFTVIRAIKTPRNQRHVRQFLGATGFFRRHVPNYARVASPLTRLLKKDTKFSWGKPQQEAFERLKQALATAPCLIQPNFEKPFELHTDASGTAIGACLMQLDKVGELHPVAYFSRKLRDAETRYPTIDLEALAVVESTRHYHPYLYGRRFRIFTDHRPLVSVFRKPTASVRMTRWAHELTFYDFELLYKPGRVHHVPDLLSRQIAAIADLDSPLLQPDLVERHQRDDPLWQQLIEYLEEGRLPPRRIPLPLDQFELRDRVLYHVKSNNERALIQLVIPRSLRGAALDAVHAVPSAGHQGVHRTYQRLRDHFYFPGMLAASRRYVASCTACQRRKGAIARTPLQSMPDVAEPFERVSVDILTLTPSARGNKYVLVLIDHLTRFVELFPLATKDAQTVADVFLAEFVTRYGPPRTLLSDNGLEFRNRLLSDICHHLQVKSLFTTVYHPQANGMVERVNRVVKDALSTLQMDDPDCWDDLLPYVRFAINSSIHRSVNDVPLYLLTGRDSHFPLVGSNHVIYAEGALPSLRSKLRAARVAAGEAARKARERWTADHDRRRRARPREYNEGDLVFVHRSVILHPSHGTRPLGPRWLGPVRVLKKLGPVAYVVRRPNSDGQEVTLHPNKFKAFRVTAEFVPPDDFPRLDGTAPPDPESDMGPLQDPGADDLLDSESSAPSSEGVDDEPWDPGSDWDE